MAAKNDQVACTSGATCAHQQEQRVVVTPPSRHRFSYIPSLIIMRDSHCIDCNDHTTQISVHTRARARARTHTMLNA